MKRPLFQLLCCTYVCLLGFMVCDGKISLGNRQLQYSRVPAAYQSTRAQIKIKGSRDSVAINQNGGVLVTNEQFDGTELTEETEIVTVEDGGLTVAINEAYEGQGTVTVEATEEGAQPTIIDIEGQYHGEEGEDQLGQPQVIDEMPSITEEPAPEIIISNQYVAGVVCHYQVGTLFFYDDAYKVQPEQIGAHYCNTLIASYAILDIDTFTIQAYSVQEEEIFLRLTELKSEALKVLLEFEIMAYYGTLVDLLTSEENIATFVSSVISYLLAFGFNGLQLPAIIPDEEVTDGQDYSYIRDGYLSLVQELSNAFLEHDLILSVALPRQPVLIETAYNLQEMLDYVAFFYLISLDYNNNGSTGYLTRTAPLTAERWNDDSYVDYSLTFLLREMNIPPYFIVMALPMYGSSFILQDANKSYFGDEYVDLGPPGPGAHITGILIISELCSLINTDWPIDDATITDYEDVTEIVEKVLYARTKQLAGVGIMSITMDDPTGDLCGFGPMPFTSIISKVFDSNNGWSCQNSLISLENLIDPSTTNKYSG